MMKQWEYKVYRGSITGLMTKLDAFGKDGWELVVAPQNSSHFVTEQCFIFKRKLIPSGSDNLGGLSVTTNT